MGSEGQNSESKRIIVVTFRGRDLEILLDVWNLSEKCDNFEFTVGAVKELLTEGLRARGEEFGRMFIEDWSSLDNWRKKYGGRGVTEEDWYVLENGLDDHRWLL